MQYEFKKASVPEQKEGKLELIKQVKRYISLARYESAWKQKGKLLRVHAHCFVCSLLIHL